MRLPTTVDTGVCWCRYTPSSEMDGLVSQLRAKCLDAACGHDETDAMARRIITQGVNAAEMLARDGQIATNELLSRCFELRGRPWEQAHARRDMRERIRIWRMLSRGDVSLPNTPKDLIALWSEATSGELPIYREANIPQFRKTGVPFAHNGKPFEQAPVAPGRETVPAEDIEREVCNLLSFAHSNNLALEERAAAIKFTLEYIHPFRDGNGHLGRMLLCRMLAQRYSPLTLLSFVCVLQTGRPEVSQTICQTVRERGDLAPFVRLMLESLREAQLEVL